MVMVALRIALALFLFLSFFSVFDRIMHMFWELITAAIASQVDHSAKNKLVTKYQTEKFKDINGVSMNQTTTSTATTATSTKPTRVEPKIGPRQCKQVLELHAIFSDEKVEREERFRAFLAFRLWVRGFFGDKQHNYDLGRLYEIFTKNKDIDEKDVALYARDIIKCFVVEEKKEEKAEAKAEAGTTPLALPPAKDEPSGTGGEDPGICMS